MKRKKFLTVSLIIDLLLDKPFIRFIFDKKKVLYEMDVTMCPRKSDIRSIRELMKYTCKSFKFAVDFNWECVHGDGNHYFYLIKEDLDVTGKHSHIKLGKYFNIPKCCLEKYLKEQKRSKIFSYNSAQRYLRQCKRMKIKVDQFRINIFHNEADCSEYGFIPCSPKCKEALRVAKITDEMQTKLMKSLNLK